MKQTDEFPGSGIKSGDVRAFKPIAMEAGHRKVIEYCFTAVLPGDNVIHLEGEPVVRVRTLVARFVEPEVGLPMG
jgi:hypothetical protein